MNSLFYIAFRQAQTAKGMETTTHDLTTKLSSSEIPHDTDLSRRLSTSDVFQAEHTIFEYLPLNTSARTIRLTRVTCNENGELRGQLRHFRFGQEPTYQALSYTWGVESAKKTILMDGKRHAVRPNLYSFFATLCSPASRSMALG
jgi:hypothetical protein